ncbi:unnamed protein product [Effrenium voratum]|uniref:Uncharacterized protein n=1 Tax=Effrenium voratum TaxID=2562239 RepID=A0AA36IGS9_9DINO|nr:unnamed protein product [Effrenium voratum]
MEASQAGKCTRCMAWMLNIKYLDTDKQAGDSLKASENEILNRGQPARVSCRRLLHAFAKLFFPYFTDRRTRVKASLLLLCVCGLTYLEVQNSVASAAAMRPLMNSLTAKDVDGFWRAFQHTVWVHARLLPIAFLHAAVVMVLILDWRKYLTTRVLDMYANKGQGYYRLSVQYGNIDNPDQRIAQDIGSFTHSSLNLVTTLCKDILKIAANSVALYEISGTLFWILLGSAVIFGVVSILFASPLMRLQRRILAVEGTLRYVLVRLREHAESVAFFRGYAFENEICKKVLDHAIWVSYKRNFVAALYIITTVISKIALDMLPIVIVGPMYLAGETSFGTIQMAQTLFHNMMQGLLDLGTQFTQIANMGAEAVRVQEIWDALVHIEATDAKKHQPSSSESDSGASTSIDDLENADVISDDDTAEELDLRDLEPSLTEVRLKLQGVTILPPLGQEPLIQNLSLSLLEGQSMLIEGTSGSGKSSLLRAIGGLWTRGSGVIERTKLDRCLFIPQTPYLCLGSLRDNILYPGAESTSEVGDDKVIEALKALGIDHLAERHGLHKELDFEKILSGAREAEDQRLPLAPAETGTGAFGRGATSALDEENERTVYELVKQQCGSYVSVGHRPSLVAMHSLRLRLDRPKGQSYCRGNLTRTRSFEPSPRTAEVSL